MSTAREAQAVVVRIRDTGCGIAPAHLGKVFDPFFSTKERGMGLGMAVVHGIIERHHGRIAIRSEPGQGTTVEVTLPCSG